MEARIIIAAWEEAKLHSLRFTMADLTRRLRMSKSSLYKLVPSKDELITDMLTYHMDKFRLVEKQLLQKEGSVLERIDKFISAYLELMQPMMKTGVYRDLELNYPSELTRWEQFIDEVLKTFTTLLHEGVEEGLIRPVNFAVVHVALMASVTALKDEQFLQDNDLTYDQAINSLRDILFQGILE